MPQQYSTLVLIALMVVAFYFLIMRPQKKRQQAMQKTMRELQPGTRVLLGSGLFGTILTVGEKQATLEISPGNELTVLKQAIVRTVTPADEDEPDEEIAAGDDLETGYAAGTVAEPDYTRPAEPDYSRPADQGDQGDPGRNPLR